MGREIHTAIFKPDDFKEFRERLIAETQLLTKWFAEDRFEKDQRVCGFELEGWLIDKDQLPASVSKVFLENFNHPLVVPELSRFNFEYNSLPHQITERLLSHFHSELTEFLETARKKAQQLDCDVASIGILPTITQSMLGKKNMHPHKRYLALDRQLRKIRHKKPIAMQINGKENLELEHHNVLIESVSTSLQIHFQMHAKKAVRYYNTAFFIAAPLVAVASNSPFLFGKSLWEETRICVFEQLMSNRISFGTHFVKESLQELFLENLNYKILLPELINIAPEKLYHLRLHNGTIWRWNRPLIDLNENGVPHLRIEHRVTSAGTSATDIVANIALFLGLMRYYANKERAPESELFFEQVKRNFYKAARFGLGAKLDWLGKNNVPLKDLLLQLLLPQAKEGLEKLAISSQDINFYIDAVIKPRIESGQTGSIWQQDYVTNHGHDFQEMVYQYKTRQHRDQPVHEW